MKYLLGLIYFTIFLFMSSCQQNEYKFRKVTTKKAKKYFRSYIQSDPELISKVFSPALAAIFVNDTTRLESFAVSENELSQLIEIFGEKTPDLTQVKPRVAIDGYRVHLGLKKRLFQKPEIAMTVTFGINKEKPLNSSGNQHPYKYYLDDQLQLGIYKILLPYSFEYPNKLKREHYSCAPVCLGDNIR